jgi:hypothetical protein
MLKALGKFAQERAGSLVSKKVGAAVAASTLAANGAPEEVTWPLVIYLIVQGVVDSFQYWVDSRPA